MALEVIFERMSDEVAVPKFRPAVMSYDHVIYEKRGHVALCDAQPARADERPATAHSHVELIEIFDDFARDDDAWVAIVTGAGERAFCAGNDLKATAAGLGRRGAARRLERALRRDHPRLRLPQAADRSGQRRGRRRRLRDRPRLRHRHRRRQRSLRPARAARRADRRRRRHPPAVAPDPAQAGHGHAPDRPPRLGRRGLPPRLRQRGRPGGGADAGGASDGRARSSSARPCSSSSPRSRRTTASAGRSTRRSPATGRSGSRGCSPRRTTSRGRRRSPSGASRSGRGADP